MCNFRIHFLFGFSYTHFICRAGVATRPQQTRSSRPHSQTLEKSGLVEFLRDAQICNGTDRRGMVEGRERDGRGKGEGGVADALSVVVSLC